MISACLTNPLGSKYGDSGMRPYWSGSISFGLVSIPVKMYSAVTESDLKFNQLHRSDLSPIRYAKMCKEDGKELSGDDIVKGYAVGHGNYVVLTDADFEKADREKTKTIDIIRFADVDEVDSIYFEKPYYLEPDKSGEKAYILLREALRRSRKVGIAQVVIKDKEHLALIKANEEGVLVLNMMRFQEEIRSIAELHIPGNEKLNEGELKVAMLLIDHLTAAFNPNEFQDHYKAELMQVIEEKAAGKTVTPHGEAPKPSNVRDLMSLLKESLAASETKAQKTSTHKAHEAGETAKKPRQKRRNA